MRPCAILAISMLAAISPLLAAQNAPAPAPSPPAAVPAAPVSGPMIDVDNITFEFGKAASGEKVHHSYIVTNTGTETLLITNVHPSCGCTTVGDWSHSIDPGKTGQISVQFDTSRYGGGQAITKTIDVYSNAKNAGRKTLLLRGAVWKPIDVTPSVAVFNIAADATNAMTSTVKIVNQTEGPVVISNPVSANKLFSAVVKEVTPGKEYELVITAEPPFHPGNSPGTITVNTSLATSPTISIPATASMQQAIQLFPAAIVLNSLQDRWVTNRVTIHGNTSAVLALANPKASDSQIHVEVQPMGPKGMFNVIVAFPPGYQLEPGHRTEITLESNNPREPMVHIPISQYPRPRAALTHRNPPVSPPAAAQISPPPHP
jgi:hypothetical protein